MDFGALATWLRLTEASASGLEGMIEAMIEPLFENPVMIPGTAMAEIPVIGEPGYVIGFDHSHFLPVICRALCARERFRITAPGWPDLPLRQVDCDELINAACIRCKVVGYYADSQRAECWNPQHPGLSEFTSGLLFDRHTPKELRNNRKLLQQFPPRRLNGMCDGRLHWCSPETLREVRHIEWMIATLEAAEAAGDTICLSLRPM